MELKLTPEQLELCHEGNFTTRSNLLTRKNYSPYCGDPNCRYDIPRTTFNKTVEQFECQCGWQSAFPQNFLDEYKKVWEK